MTHLTGEPRQGHPSDTPTLLSDGLEGPSEGLSSARPEGGAAGLVISPITRETVLTVADVVGETFSFPSSDMLDAAASMFPTARDRAVVTGWHGMVGRGVATRSHQAIAGYSENRENIEGARPRIEIAPGLVRLARRDEAKAERTRERVAEADRAATAYELEQLRRPMALADIRRVGRGRREKITGWSADSRARMVSSICELDLSPLVAGEQIPGMFVLTAPSDWLAVFPDAKAAARKFDNFFRAWADEWKTPLRCIWKREFQARRQAPRTLAGLDSGHAPHWHIWAVPPVPQNRIPEFKAWLSRTWVRILFGKRAAARAVDHHELNILGAYRGTCEEEACKSLRAGTGVDFAEGLRARDPKRLAIYFLKESMGGEGKAYQNDAPPEWAGQSVGRFWGYRGIEKAVVSVEIDPGIDVQLARCLRRWQRSKGVTAQVTVQRVDTRTGRVYTRRVRRPQRVLGSAGWVAANSGAALAADLGRYASVLSAELWRDRDLFAPDPDAETSVSVTWPGWAAHGPLRFQGGYPVPALSGPVRHSETLGGCLDPDTRDGVERL